MAERSAAALRRPVAVLLSRFPLVTETFILREVIEMERQGQPVRLVPLIREAPATVHPEALPWMRRALYTPLLSLAILAANARAVRRDPSLYARLLGRVLLGSAGSPHLFARTLALFPKCVYLAERLRQEGIAHVHAHFATHPALAALVISTLARIPYSVTVHAHDIFVRRALLPEKLEAASFVRAISRFNRDFLAARYPELAGKIEVIHTGIDPAGYAAALPAGPAEVSTLLCVAALKPYKGLSVLVEACRRLRNDGVAFRCELVGEGPERARLQSEILRARLQDRVRLAGALPQQEVARRLADATVFVLPSVVAPDGQMEGIPVALMEAMAAGRPVVASALSGIPELVTDGESGLLVPPADVERLVDALRTLLSDPARARRMGQRGRATVEREYRLNRVVGRLLERIDADLVPADENVLDAVAAAGWPGFSTHAIGVRRVHEGRDSTAAELLVPNGTGPREVVLKLHRDFAGQSSPPPERTRHEFETLCRLQDVFAGKRGLGVPRPLHLHAEHATLVLDACAGVPLDGLLREARWKGEATCRDAVAAVGRTGEWLRLLHGSTARDEPGARAVEDVAAGARADLAACITGLPPAVAGRLAHRVAILADEARPWPPMLVGRHGDFWPGNVYVTRERVQVIDFEGFGEGLAAEDVARFLVQIDLFYAYPGLAATRAALRAAFLDGYGRERVEASSYALCRVASALQALRRASGLPRGPRPWWRRRAILRLLAER
ncbi:MAG TPA: glycosyltransferase [Vicinamibacteria bacterium]|nr:glycosyltransferase [Vicinamibacteria bacterium]